METLICVHCGCYINGRVVTLVDSPRVYCSEACLDDDIEQPAAD
ncbi:MAG TPA: hypothetical protein VFC63_16985 [Blastocatellia bacterium]|nr:hypothetical protein [Blastocatellia bacterium]